MLTFAIIAVLWAFVAVSCHYRRRTYYRKHPYMWNRRHEGLISFNDRQYWWIMTLWPIAIVVAILYLIMLLVCLVVEQIKDRWEDRRRVPK